MKYEKSVYKKIEIVDSVIAGIGEPTVLNNPDFYPDIYFDYPHYTQFHFRKSGKISGSFIFSSDELVIGLDRVDELYSFGNEHILNKNKDIINVISNIMSSNIEVSYVTSMYTSFVFCSDQSEFRTIGRVDVFARPFEWSSGKRLYSSFY